LLELCSVKALIGVSLEGSAKLSLTRGVSLALLQIYQLLLECLALLFETQ
jgi:hypothetical protein